MSKVCKGDEASSADEEASSGLSAERKRTPSPRNCRTFIRKKVADAMPDVVKTFVVQAKKGSVAHFNALTKLGGFDHRPVAAEAPKRLGKSLARRMLDDVESYEARRAAELAAADQRTLLIDDGSQQERS